MTFNEWITSHTAGNPEAKARRIKTKPKMTVREFARAGFEITGLAFSDSIESLAAKEMERQGWQFIEYDQDGDELFEAPV